MIDIQANSKSEVQLRKDMTNIAKACKSKDMQRPKEKKVQRNGVGRRAPHWFPALLRASLPAFGGTLLVRPHVAPAINHICK